MAGISYPDSKAKASDVPAVRGQLLANFPELPGAWISALPHEDPRLGKLLEGQGKVGPLPPAKARWQGISVRGESVILSYRVGSRQILEISRAQGPETIERLISVDAGREPVALRIAGSEGKISGSGTIKTVELNESEWPFLHIAGNGRFKLSGESLQVPASSDPGLFRVLLSKEPISEIPKFEGFPPPSAAKNIFPEETKVTSETTTEKGSPIAYRDLALPANNPWKRAVRPTDIAFLSDGTALITTLDGDVWKVQDIGKSTAVWTRAAYGIFEPMSVAINSDDQVFVLGRDQITRLDDTDGDGFFDNYVCASDAFMQTLHTRDFATSLELAGDGSYLIGRSGLIDKGLHKFTETSGDRGTVIRISPDGSQASTIADGFRIPFIGRRRDGTVFSSDQQGNFIPSSPIHLIGDDVPFLGYGPSDFRKKKAAVPPLFWFPHQINRSGSSFANLSEKGFPSLGESFVHLSWAGRVFPLRTPSTGLPFAWKFPTDFDFPILGGATHPLNGKLYAVGIGISGYQPTTPKEIGMAEIFEEYPLVSVESVVVEPESITLSFRDPLPPALSLIAPRPEIHMWNIRRTPDYGSGHFRWNGQPGEETIEAGSLDIAPDRKSVSISTPEIFRSEILRLRLNVRDTTGSHPPYQIEIYASPTNLEVASPSDLERIGKREKSSATPLVAGKAALGSKLFVNYGCIGCHSLTGEKLTGPPLGGIASRHPTDLKNYLRQSILEPTAVVVENYEASMPSFAGVIPDQDIEHLVAYLKTLE